MNDAFCMGGIQSVRDFDGEIEEMFRLHRLRGYELTESFAFEILHDDEGAAIMLADLMNRTDIGVVEGGGSTGFTAKALE